MTRLNFQYCAAPETSPPETFHKRGQTQIENKQLLLLKFLKKELNLKQPRPQLDFYLVFEKYEFKSTRFAPINVDLVVITIDEA